MKRPAILTILVGLGVLTAFGRLSRLYDMKTLVAESKLVFVGRVKSVKPSGITTTSSYPTWEGAIFEWLQVDVEVLEPIKATKKGEVVQTAMLSLIEPKKRRLGDIRLNNEPGMIEPEIGQAFLFFLVPTDKTNLFASFKAPYDDDEAIFRLDRSYWKYSSYREGRDEQFPIIHERHSVIWSLVDDAGQITPSGAELMRKTYAKEIETVSSNGVIHLQWQTYTDPSGWRHDIPKEAGHETNVNRR